MPQEPVIQSGPPDVPEISAPVREMVMVQTVCHHILTLRRLTCSSFPSRTLAPSDPRARLWPRIHRHRQTSRHTAYRRVAVEQLSPYEKVNLPASRIYRSNCVAVFALFLLQHHSCSSTALRENRRVCPEHNSASVQQRCRLCTVSCRVWWVICSSLRR